MSRWLHAFHLLFYACLTFPTAVVALMVTGGGRPLTLGLAAAMGVYYWLFVVRRSEDLELDAPDEEHLIVVCLVPTDQNAAATFPRGDRTIADGAVVATLLAT
ncbi:hypothetical protein AB0K48_55870, partial [Nonomuraea sp. NPDC055795]